MVFAIGFLAGFVANWVFGMITRLLPDTMVRWNVKLGEPLQKQGLGGIQWVIPTIISPPSWRRVIMEPLREYLEAEVRANGDDCVSSKWDEGDTNKSRLLTDGAMTIPVIVLTYAGGTLYLADKFGERNYAVVSPNRLEIKVTRSFDGSIAAKTTVTMTRSASDIS